MLILAVETSSACGSIALARNRELLVELDLGEGLVHGRSLVPRIKEALQTTNLDLHQVDMLAISIGPGSFTGLRVGCICVKTLAYALRRPVAEVSSLEVLAHNSPPTERTIVTAVDARRRRLYLASFKFQDSRIIRLEEDRVVNPGEIPALISPSSLILGDALRRYRELFERLRDARFTAPELWIPRAGMVARLGYQRALRKEFANSLTLAPRYLQRPEAEEIWERKHRSP